MRFVLGHSSEDRAAPVIGRRQATQVVVEVRFDLALGFGDEAQARRIAPNAREHPDAKASRVPQRIEHARAAVELAKALRAPGEMVALFTRRRLQLAPRFVRASE